MIQFDSRVEEEQETATKMLSRRTNGGPATPLPHQRRNWRRWFRAPYRLPIVHTVLILTFMLALYAGWTDFTPQPYDSVYLPYLIISGPIVYWVGHVAMHRVDPLISVDEGFSDTRH